jgi:hypothetical protein
MESSKVIQPTKNVRVNGLITKILSLSRGMKRAREKAVGRSTDSSDVSLSVSVDASSDVWSIET